jgi:hypothetical protein
MSDTLTTDRSTVIDVGAIIDFENGELTEDEVVELFQVLIDTGVVWRLQGFYGRTATDLIEAGLCTPAEVALG